ncbi:GAF domain-containing protein [Rhodococcus sp. WS4]|nr:GAF domain-containing protein [Rhodococcus sp. WS4]
MGDDDRPTAEYVDRASTDTVLERAARSVMPALTEDIENEPVSLILTDANGIVLSRTGGDRALFTALDRVDLAPGYRYAESQVGTNGIGTALEVGRPLLVDGDQHFSGPLRSFSCAGAPVTHPVTGAILGVVDLTTAAQNSNALLLSFATLAAARLRERMIDDASELDRAIFSAYRSACRRTGRPVIAVGEEVVMMNSLTRQEFDSPDQMAILERTRDIGGETNPVTILTDLPSGTMARLSYEPAFAGDRLAGGIVRITKQVPARHLSLLEVNAPTPPSLAGASPLWRHTVQAVVEASRRQDWLVLDGEPGVGKTAVIRAAHQLVPERGLAVLDATELGADDVLAQTSRELAGESDLAILHAHTLDEAHRAALADLLQDLPLQGSPRAPWVALTRYPQESTDTSPLLRMFPKSVTVPPLRHHLDDIPDLVRSLLDTLGATDLTLAPAALNQLARLAWRGNVTQLRNVLADIYRRQRSGVVEVDTLPPACRSTTRRTLTRLEALERDAIVDTLTLHAGDKTAAAAAIGMSRATIYRRIREFGIVL